MLFKRHYDIPSGWEPERGPDGALLNPLPVAGLEVKHTGTHAEQTFSRRFIDAGLAEGWVSLSRGALIIHALDGDFTYTVARMPGSYCCHCDAPLADDPSGALGRAHVEANHAGVPSPDVTNPAGYCVTHAYECVLDEAQHAQWNAQAVMQRMADGGEKH
jgi:hypothetical protein